MSPEFMESLQAALEIARHAPSSHNCQPWALGYLSRPVKGRVLDGLARSYPGLSLGKGRADQVLCLALNRNRALKALPAHDLEMKLSCGLFLHPLIKALALTGWGVKGVVYTGTDAPIDVPSRYWPEHFIPLAHVILHPVDPLDSEAWDGGLDRLRDAMGNRCTNRMDFGPGALSEHKRGLLLQESTSVMPLQGQGVSLRFHVDPDEIKGTGQLVARHGGIDFSHGSAWRETYGFIRFSHRGEARAEDGFSIEHLLGGMPWAKRAALKLLLSPPAMGCLRHVGLHRHMARKMGALVSETGTLVSLAFPDATATVGDEIEAGCALSEFWLQADREGLVLHPISVMLQHTRAREALQGLLGVPGRMVFFARVGLPMRPCRPSPRQAATGEILRVV